LRIVSPEIRVRADTRKRIGTAKKEGTGWGGNRLGEAVSEGGEACQGDEVGSSARFGQGRGKKSPRWEKKRKKEEWERRG